MRSRRKARLHAPQSNVQQSGLFAFGAGVLMGAQAGQLSPSVSLACGGPAVRIGGSDVSGSLRVFQSICLPPVGQGVNESMPMKSGRR